MAIGPAGGGESLADTLSRLATAPDSGLDESEAARRLAASGPNELPPPPRRSVPLRFLDQLREPMNLLLLGAVVVSGGALRKGIDALAIAAIVVINAVIALVQEGRADRALAALEQFSAPEATVRRGGVAQRVPASRLVAGDVVLIEPGDRIPADLRLLAVANLEVDESLLTGESVPMAKSMSEGGDTTLDSDRAVDRLWWGTFVTRGTATGVVVATGAATRLGGIATSLHQPSPRTPLQEELGRLSARLGAAAVAIAAMVFAVTLMRVGWSLEGLEQSLLSAVALAVAAVPEGLPTVTLVALAAGVRRMATHRAIVRRLPAVETLGSASVIVTDKTGTITENRMTVTRVWVPGGVEQGPAELAGPVAGRARRIAALANDARLDPESGDPMELALLRFAVRGHGARRPALACRIASFPVDSERKRMSVAQPEDGGLLIAAKGAPETLLERCTSLVDHKGRERALTQHDRDEVLAHAAAMASDGMRVLALADRVATDPPRDADEAERGLTFVALVALEDPVRPSAAAAVAESAAAGIRVVMATGDHPATALAIAKDIGLDTRLPPVTGDQFRDDPQPALLDRPVFARVEPQQKLALVRALQQRGEVVAMTGDGVNDAPALRRADIGVALGARGSDVAREAADMVVTDDELATIVTATREGRGIYDNVRKVVDYLVAGNLSEIGVVVGALLLLPWLGVPLLPLQLLWINLLTDGLPAVALGNDRHGTDLMHQMPRPRREHLLDRKRLTHLVVRGALMAAACLSAGLAATRLRDGDPEVVRTVLLTTLVLVHLLYAFVARQPAYASLKDRLAPAGWLGTRWLASAVAGGFLLHLVVLTWRPAQQVFGTVAPDGIEWLLIVAGALAGLLLTVIHRRLAGGTEGPAWSTAPSSADRASPR